MIADADILLYHLFVSYPGRFFKVFEFLWLWPIVLMLVGSKDQRQSGKSLIIYGACFAAAALPAILVWDLDRSLVYLIPGVLAAICFSPLDPLRRRRWAILILFACLLWVEPNSSVLRLLLF